MLKAIRNSLVYSSVLYIMLGVILLIFPDTALRLACTMIGAVTLVCGIIRIVGYFKAGSSYSNRFDLFLGVLLSALGVFLLITPQFIVSIVPIALGVYILVDSFTAIKKALDMKSLGFEKWWVSFLAALLLAVSGVVMIVNPFGTVSALVMFIGAGFIFDGVYTLVNTIVADRLFKNS